MISTLRMSRAMLSIAWRADRRVTSTILCVALGEAIAVAAGALVQRIVVDAAGREAIAGLVLAVAVGALARVALSVYWRVRVNYELDLNARIDVELNREILQWSATIPTVAHLEEGQYLDRLSLLRRNTMSIAASAWAFTGTAASVISVSLSVFLLARVHLALAALAVLALPPIWAAGRAQRYLEQARAATAEDQRLETTLHELCVDAAAAKELFLSGAGSVLDAEADRARSRVLQAVLRARIHAVKWQLLSWATFATGFVGALMLTTALIQRGRASLGDLVLVITLGSSLREQVHATVDGFSKIADAGHATAHYDWLRSFARDREATFAGVKPPPERLQHGIELRDVEFRYPSSDRPGVAGINLTLVAGTTVAFVGANGAGKTTLVKLLTGMYAPTGGSVLVDGIDLQEMDLSGWRARVSGTFQDFVRFELPVRSTVGIGDLTRADDAGVVASAVTGAHADDLVAQLPHGLDTQLGRTYDGVELSHGQWQRMALARGLVRRDPLLLVLDEPTAALDPLAEQEMYDLFLAQATGANGRITLLVSHRYSTVSAADHIVVMDSGRIAEQGTHADLLGIGGIYADHFAMQSRAYGQT